MAPNPQDLDRFVEAAKRQIGDKYQFGAHADLGDPDPDAFDSSELVEWAAHQAGVTDMPDGSWKQYEHLEKAGATTSLQTALDTKGALVFGFDGPKDANGRPARAYVGISLGDGTVLDVSERSGEVRIMPHGGFYQQGAVIPELHGMPDPVQLPGPGETVTIPGAYGPSQNPLEDPVCRPEPEPDPEDQVCRPEDEDDDVLAPPAPEAPEDNVCRPGDDEPDYDSDYQVDPLEYLDGASLTPAAGDQLAYADTSAESVGSVGSVDSVDSVGSSDNADPVGDAGGGFSSYSDSFSEV